jgi:hypothetical protein
LTGLAYHYHLIIVDCVCAIGPLDAAIMRQRARHRAYELLSVALHEPLASLLSVATRSLPFDFHEQTEKQKAEAEVILILDEN